MHRMAEALGKGLDGAAPEASQAPPHQNGHDPGGGREGHRVQRSGAAPGLRQPVGDYADHMAGMRSVQGLIHSKTH